MSISVCFGMLPSQAAVWYGFDEVENDPAMRYAFDSSAMETKHLLDSMQAEAQKQYIDSQKNTAAKAGKLKPPPRRRRG